MNPTQEVIEKLKVLRLDLSEDIGDWSHSIMAIEAALALLQPVATGPSTLDDVPRYSFRCDHGLCERMQYHDAPYVTFADITALVRRLEEENRKLRNEHGAAWALLGHTYADSYNSIPDALRDIAQRLQEQDAHAWELRGKWEAAEAEVARLAAENAALKKELGR